MRQYKDLLSCFLDKGTSAQDINQALSYSLRFDLAFGKVLPITSVNILSPSDSICNALQELTNDVTCGFPTSQKTIELKPSSKEDEVMPHLGFKDIGQLYIRDEKTNNKVMHHLWQRDIQTLHKIQQDLKERNDSVVHAKAKTETRSPVNNRHNILTWHFIRRKLSLHERQEAHIIRYENRAAWEKSSFDGVRKNIKMFFSANEDKIEETLASIKAPVYGVNLVLNVSSVDVIDAWELMTHAAMCFYMLVSGMGDAFVPDSLTINIGKAYLFIEDLDLAYAYKRALDVEYENTRFIINPKIRTMDDLLKASKKDFRVFGYQCIRSENSE